MLLESGKSELAVILFSVDKTGIKRNRVNTLQELRRLIDKEEL